MAGNESAILPQNFIRNVANPSEKMADGSTNSHYATLEIEGGAPGNPTPPVEKNSESPSSRAEISSEISSDPTLSPPSKPQKPKKSRVLKINPRVYRYMRMHGYTKEAAITHSVRVLSPKEIKEELEKEFPNDFLFDRHFALLTKEQKKVFYNPKTDVTTTVTLGIDADAVAKGLEMAYKMKGYLKPEKIEVNQSMFANLSDEELQQIAFGKVVDAEYRDVPNP